jgi:DNA-binding response OmpR family regulator
MRRAARRNRSRARAVKGRILVIDDSRSIVDLIRTALQKEQYEVLSAQDAESGLKRARMLRPDLVVLDIGLPGMDGMAFLKTFRGKSDVPVIFLTGRGDELSRVLGLKLGADDYMIKPFSALELAARVEALLRRSSKAPTGPGLLVAGSLRLDPRAHEVRLADKVVPLEPKEFSILSILLKAGGEVVSRQQMLLEVWGYSKNLGMNMRMVDQYVSRLRRKLRKEGLRIATVPTLGYKINP